MSRKWLYTAITRATNLENVVLIDYDEYEEDDKYLIAYLQQRWIDIASKIRRRKDRSIPATLLQANGLTVVSVNAAKIAVRA